MLRVKDVIVKYENGEEEFTNISLSHWSREDLRDFGDVKGIADICTRQYVRSKASELFEIALQNMTRRPGVPSNLSAEQYTDEHYYRDSMQTFMAACEIAQVVGEWVRIKESPDLQGRLPAVTKSGIGYLQRLYAVPESISDEEVEAITLKLGLAAASFIEVIADCSTDETWYDILLLEGISSFACTAWAHGHHSHDPTIVAGASRYLQFLRLESTFCEEDREPIRQVFGDGTRFAWSLTSVLRRAYDLELCTAKWSMLMGYVFYTMTKSLRVEDTYFEDVRSALMQDGSATLFLAAVLPRLRSSVSSDDNISTEHASDALLKCLWFLRQAFSAYDGQLWAEWTVRPGLPLTLYKLEGLLDNLSDNVFQMYQDVILMLIPLSNGERLFKTILPEIRRVWEEEGFGVDSSKHERRLVENEISKLALIKLLRKKGWNPFPYACCNVSLIHLLIEHRLKMMF